MAEHRKALRALFGPAADEGDRIRHRLGTQRARDPRETVSVLHRHARFLGVTRVVDLTPLDRIGLPVFTVCVPNAWGEAYSCGKGISRVNAMASALMEAAEYRAARGQRARTYEALTLSEARRLGPVLDPNRLQGLLPGLKRLGPRDRADWVWAAELFSGRTALAPLNLMSANAGFTPASKVLYDKLTSTGLSGGNSVREATLHALYELLERDAYILSSFGKADRIDLATLPAGSPAASIVERIQAAGCSLQVLDITSDAGVPAFHAILSEQCGFREAHIHDGAGCHHDPEVALLRAITEACQVRLTYFTGSREDVGIGTSTTRRMRRREAACRALRSRPFSGVRGASHATISMALEAALRRLSAMGLEQAWVGDLSMPGFPFPIVKVFVPGLEIDVNWSFDHRRLGNRALLRFKEHGLSPLLGGPSS